MTDIENLKHLNSGIKVVESDEGFNLHNLWGEDAFYCLIQKKDIALVSKLIFPPQLSAVIHTDKHLLEFIYAPIEESEKLLKRHFVFHYDNAKFEMYFGLQSDAVIALAKGLNETGESRTDCRNLYKFRDYHNRKKFPKDLRKYYEHRKPYSFYIKSNVDVAKLDIVNFCKHVNFYMRFFDRDSPSILTHALPDLSVEKYEKPCLLSKKQFPSDIIGCKFDPVLIDLFEIAENTGAIRLRYLFYYQVLEYCAYYSLTDELKRKIQNIINRPDIISSSESYSKQLIDSFKDYFKTNDDKQKLEHFIHQNCEVDDFRHEIECNLSYFAKDISFEGGFVLSALIDDKVDFNKPQPQLKKTLVDRLDKIRNVLVHIRESRENKVILPSLKNHRQLRPYLYLIHRIAEIAAINFSK